MPNFITSIQFQEENNISMLMSIVFFPAFSTHAVYGIKCFFFSLLNHFDQHSVLTQLNHGFRAGLLCKTQLAVTLHDLTESFGMNTQTEILFYI